MNATSAFRAEAATPATATQRILVWDAPVRVFHGLMALCFAVAWFTAESEYGRLWHVTAGYTMIGLVAFRLVWGAVGTRHARFAAFVRGPAASWRYLLSLWRRRPEHHVGHNPAGAWAIVGLLALTLGVTLTGWATYNELGGGWNEDLHEALANGMLALVGVHVLGVVLSSWLHRENLVRAMVTGRKRGAAAQAVRSARHGVAVLMVLAVMGFWAWQWQAPVDAPTATSPAALRATPVGELADRRDQGKRNNQGNRDNDRDD